jgi:hypothetical protein
MFATRQQSGYQFGDLAGQGREGEREKGRADTLARTARSDRPITHHWELEVYQLASWLEHAVKCEYLLHAPATKLFRQYDHIIGKLVIMQNNPQPWLLTPRHKRA